MIFFTCNNKRRNLKDVFLVPAVVQDSWPSVKIVLYYTHSLFPLKSTGACALLQTTCMLLFAEKDNISIDN